jgi:hypothetical protein
MGQRGGHAVDSEARRLGRVSIFAPVLNLLRSGHSYAAVLPLPSEASILTAREPRVLGHILVSSPQGHARATRDAKIVDDFIVSAL